MCKSDPDDRVRRRLMQIAHALNVSEETFFDRSEAQLAGSSEVEEQELVSLFQELRDPYQRRRCLNLIRAMVRQPEIK